MKPNRKLNYSSVKNTKDNNPRDHTVLWEELAGILSTPRKGEKDGPAFMPFTMRTRRSVECAISSDMLALDLDCGVTVDEVQAKLKAANFESVIYTTHSHFSTTTEILRSLLDDRALTPEQALLEKGVIPDIARQAKRGTDSIRSRTTIHRGTSTTDTIPTVIIEHPPIPKMRIVLPLAQTFSVVDHGGTARAQLVWREFYYRVSHLLGVEADYAAADLARIFFLPRVHDERAEHFRAVHVEGVYLDMDNVFPPGDRANLKADEPRQHTPKVVDRDKQQFSRHIGSIGDTTLQRWLGRKKPNLKELIERSAWPILSSTRGKLHLVCPYEDSHSSLRFDGDTSCSLVRNGLVCLHNNCKDRDRIEFLSRAIDNGWITEADAPELWALAAKDSARILQASESSLDHNPDPSVIISSPEEISGGPVELTSEMIAENQRQMLARGEDRLKVFASKWSLLATQSKISYVRWVNSPLDEGRQILAQYTNAAMRDLCAREYIDVPGKAPGTVERVSLFECWRKSPCRKTYEAGLIFDPGAAPEVKTKSGLALNLWRGFAIKPVAGDWNLMRKHICEVICDGNEACYHYLIHWIARMFQVPGKRAEVAVVLRGVQGAGKGTLGTFLRRMVGQQHSLHISNSKHLVGHFNAHLGGTVFLFADEAFYAGDKASIGILKALITEDVLAIEPKGQDVYQLRNCLHILMATNEAWAVPTDLDDRRFFVLEINESRKRDKLYFDALHAQMEAGGMEAMLFDLLKMNLTDFDIYSYPQTAALADQKIQSLIGFNHWMVDLLTRGYVYESEYGSEVLYEWREAETRDLLYASYEQHQRGLPPYRKVPMTRTMFTQMFSKVHDKVHGHKDYSRRLPYATGGNRIGKLAPIGEAKDKLEKESPNTHVIYQSNRRGVVLGSLFRARYYFAQYLGFTPTEWESEGFDDPFSSATLPNIPNEIL